VQRDGGVARALSRRAHEGRLILTLKSNKGTVFDFSGDHAGGRFS